MLFFGLVSIALVLTMTMFKTRQAMLGFPCAMFWCMFGAYCFTLSTVPWGDLYYYLFWSSSFGMTTFSALAAFGLREKRDTIHDVEGDEDGEGELPYIDEVQESPFENKKPSRSDRIRQRAEERRIR